MERSGDRRKKTSSLAPITLCNCVPQLRDEDGEDGEEEDDGDENDSFGVNVRGASAYSAPLEDVCMSSCTYIRVIMVNGVCV